MLRTLALLTALASFAASTAYAHLGSTKYLRVERTAPGVQLVADLDPIDVAYELGLSNPSVPAASLLRAHRPGIAAWASRAFVVRSPSATCTNRVHSIEVVPFEGARMREAVRIAIRFECRTHEALVLEDRSVFAADPQHEAIVEYAGRATVLRAGRQTLALEEPPSALDTIGTFVAEGARHLVTGYDHLLFLLSLLLTAGLVAARDGRRRAIRDVAVVVTGFTFGHSITLIAAALDVVTLPSRWVESAIAASIAIVAAWNVVRPEQRTGLATVAAVFGLIHGFGFSSVLRELVLPSGERILALLSFNVGIELAQLAIVVAVVPMLGWLAARPWYRSVVVRGGSIAIGLCGLAWFVERAFFGAA